jgi:flagellar biosynthesis protein FliP
VLTKKEFHKSNLAISYNMIDQIKVNEELEKRIVDFMYDQIQDNYLDKFRQINNAKLKKHMIMNYIDKKYFDKR